MKKNILFMISALLVLTSCAGNAPEEEGGSSLKPILENQTYSKTIEFSGETFSSQFTEATNFTQTSSSKNQELFTYINNQLEYDGLISTLNLDYITVRSYNGTNYLQISTGKPTDLNPGTFEWKSYVEITKIEIICYAYSKPYTQQNTYYPNVDSNAKLLIDGEPKTLQLDADGNPAPTMFVKEYVAANKKFTLSTTGGRILIKNITVHWRG